MTYIIYLLENERTGKSYVGATTVSNPADRRRRHFQDMRRGRGVNKAIQADFDLHGQASFRFTVLAQTLIPCRHQLRELEELCIAQLAPQYNVNRTPDVIPPSRVRRVRKPRPAPRFITAAGVTKQLAQWSRDSGIDWVKIHARLALGWTPEEAVGLTPRIKPQRKPNVKKTLYEYDGKRLDVDQLAARAGVSRATMYQRLAKLKWTVAQAMGDEPSPIELERAELAKKRAEKPKRPRGRPRKNV